MPRIPWGFTDIPREVRQTFDCSKEAEKLVDLKKTNSNDPRIPDAEANLEQLASKLEDKLSKRIDEGRHRFKSKSIAKDCVAWYRPTKASPEDPKEAEAESGIKAELKEHMPKRDPEHDVDEHEDEDSHETNKRNLQELPGGF